MTIPTVLTRDQAVEHLRAVECGGDDGDLQLKIDAATQLVCEYIMDRQPEDTDWIDTIEGWTTNSVPAVIRTAVMLQVAELYRFRGDDEDGVAPMSAETGGLAPIVARMLHRYRSPAIA